LEKGKTTGLALIQLQINPQKLFQQQKSSSRNRFILAMR